MKVFKIEKRIVSQRYKPLIIPEIGINHNGSLETAIKIVDAAKRAGAEIIKHQTHMPDFEMSVEAKKIKPGNSKRNIYDIILKSTLSEEDEYKLFRYVKKKGMIFLSTPFCREASDRLNRFGVNAFKIGSGEMNNIPLIDHISKYNKPMIVSTGMHSLKNVEKTVNFLKRKKANFALLHTTNLYPTPDHLVRLNSINQLKEKFSNIQIGLSDHTQSNISAIGAISLGATIIEKHFVDKKTRKGPDISSSMDENQLKDLIKDSEIIFRQIKGDKKSLKEEQVTRNFAFSSVVSIKKIKKGEMFSLKNLWVKRPGTGYLSSDKLNKIIGKKAKRIIHKNYQIKKNDF